MVANQVSSDFWELVLHTFILPLSLVDGGIFWTYTEFKTKTPKACTCESCPMFKDYQDNGRGLCTIFDKVYRKHHALTQDCLSSLPSEIEEFKAEEDRLYCNYQQGDSVKLIDSHSLLNYYLVANATDEKTLSFSKKLETHIGVIWYFIHHYNSSLLV